MDRIFNCPKIVTTNLKKYGIISEIQFGGVIMESGKNNRNKEILDDYIGYKLATENSSQHSSFNLKGIVVAVLMPCASNAHTQAVTILLKKAVATV